MAQDPVCGMQLDQNQAKAQSQYQGQTYQFCSESCKQRFDQNPQQYAMKQQSQMRGGGGQQR